MSSRRSCNSSIGRPTIRKPPVSPSKETSRTSEPSAQPWGQEISSNAATLNSSIVSDGQQPWNPWMNSRHIRLLAGPDPLAASLCGIFALPGRQECMRGAEVRGLQLQSKRSRGSAVEDLARMPIP
ncbi:hypothetical protein WJX84_012266 [Apatococcus fuscideae]|uniref:Uncharacterized protein n=1 Tax=Apatococcus fuscideae TaxID=2026836 RepID=A0AAW1T6C4_9CHLO